MVLWEEESPKETKVSGKLGLRRLEMAEIEISVRNHSLWGRDLFFNYSYVKRIGNNKREIKELMMKKNSKITKTASSI